MTQVFSSTGNLAEMAHRLASWLGPKPVVEHLGPLAIALLPGIAVCAGLLGGRLPQFQPVRRPALTWWVAAVVTTCLLMQLHWPALFFALRRDGAVNLGQYYRLLTALFFQDGWLIGGLFNVAVLVYVGSAAERVLSRWS